MNYESGFGANGSPYEYDVPVSKNMKTTLMKLALCLLYAAWGIGFLVLGSVIRLIWPFLAFIPLSLWGLFYLTWRYTQVSYQYSFFCGEMKVLRVFGGRTKRLIFNVKIKELTGVYACDGKQEEKINQFSPDKVIFAASSENASNLTLVFCTNETNEKIALYFEADEKANRILRYYNASVMETK